MENKIYQMAASNYNIPSLPEETVVAMAYVPFQNPTAIYSAEEGFPVGTLFPCLNKPFLGCGGDNK